MQRRLIDAASQALGVVLKFEHPADSVLSAYFQQNPAFGQKDRHFIAETVFGVLRHARVLDHLTSAGSARQLVLGWLARFSGTSLRDLASALRPDEIDWMARLKSAGLES